MRKIEYPICYFCDEVITENRLGICYYDYIEGKEIDAHIDCKVYDDDRQGWDDFWDND